MLWMVIPAISSRPNDTAISPTTRMRLKRPIFSPVVRPSSLITAARSVRDARIAGTMPETSVTSSVLTVTNSSTMPSMRMSIQKGGLVSTMARLNIVMPS